MKKLLLLPLFALCIGGLMQAEKIRVATAGDSLTGASKDFGFYGAPLAEMLGDDYEVIKFGRGGSGLFRKMREDGTNEKSPNEYRWAYYNSDEAEALMEFQPHIIMISIGANDAKRENFVKYGREVWKQDYIDLINKFKSLPTNPQIFIAIPPPMFYGDGGFMGSFDDSVAREFMHPVVKEIAAEMDGVTLVDFYTPMEGKSELFPGGTDWVHPDHRGHYIMAKAVYEAIMGKPFTMNPGGVTIEANNMGIKLQGKKNFKNGAYQQVGIGSEMYLQNVEFGSIATYNTVEVEAKMNRVSGGSFDFYLDDETAPFASVSTAGIPKKFSTISANFDRKIVGEHKVTIKWNGQDSGIKSVTFKEKLKPFVNDDYTKKFYIVNKATGKVLDTDTKEKTVFLSDYDPSKTTQQFHIEHYTYKMYFIRNIDEKLHIQINDDKVILDKVGDHWRQHDPKYCIYIEPTEDGSFTLELSPNQKMGWNGSKLVGNGTQASDSFEWEIVEADQMGK